MPGSISQYVLKVASRCDLACNHCYVYEHADQSWRAKPRFITQAIARQAARRISEHAEAHQLTTVHVVLHGGEPLLLGARQAARDSQHAAVLDRSGGPAGSAHPYQRRPARRGPLRAVRRLRRSGGGVARRRSRGQRPATGCSPAGGAAIRKSGGPCPCSGSRSTGTCTRASCARSTCRNDPVAVYEALRAEAPPRVDLLLPHATWEQPPYRPADADTPYAAWLGRIHARWLADGRPMPVRFFDSLLDAWEGRPSGSEAAGLDPVDLLVIETDGSWEQADSLKTAFDGAPETGLDVFSHSVDEAAAFAGVVSRQGGLAALCRICRECPVVQACGGGLYAHRYSHENGFDNPSVYCDDLKKLIPAVIAGAPGPAVPSGAAGRHPGLPGQACPARGRLRAALRRPRR